MIWRVILSQIAVPSEEASGTCNWSFSASLLQKKVQTVENLKGCFYEMYENDGDDG